MDKWVQTGFISDHTIVKTNIQYIQFSESISRYIGTQGYYTLPDLPFEQNGVFSWNPRNVQIT